MVKVTSAHIVPIDLSLTPPAPSYDIIIGENTLSDAGQLIAARLGRRRCLIVTDSHVGPLYESRLAFALTAAGHILLPTLIVPAGESSKDQATLFGLLERMLAAGVDRKIVIIALGGGVIGDLSGCAASLLMRGVDFVQIPTTLLAQVDSSVGGKTGIDTVHGKNTIGTFHQPRLVIIDVTLLDSLPVREQRAGYAEIVKYGLIRDRAFFEWCCGHGGQLLDGTRPAQIYAIRASCAHKAQVVAADEHEAGERALLNLGHTFGHALETATGYGEILLHGEAVAIGCILAFQLSVQLGLCPAPDLDAVRHHFKEVGLPVTLQTVFSKGDLDPERLLALMMHDKKAEDGKLTLILARGIGQAFIARDVSPDAVRLVWQSLTSATD